MKNQQEFVKSAMKISRRQFLVGSGVTVAASVALPAKVSMIGLPPLAPAILKKLPEKKLFMYNINTGEWLREIFWADGDYNHEAIPQINKFFRDWRSGTKANIDKNLLTLLHSIKTSTETTKPIELVSGFRSDKTNGALRTKSKQVAQNSFHKKGQAADIRIPGVSLHNLRNAAYSLDAGGVGYYPKSGFIHVDVRSGSKKRWSGA